MSALYAGTLRRVTASVLSQPSKKLKKSQFGKAGQVLLTRPIEHPNRL